MGAQKAGEVGMPRVAQGPHAGAGMTEQPSAPTILISLRWRRLGELVESFVVETTPAARPARVDLHENSIVLVAGSAHHRGDSPSVDELLDMLTRGLRVVETGARKRGRRNPQVALVTDSGGLLTGFVFFDADHDGGKVRNVSASTAALTARNER